MPEYVPRCPLPSDFDAFTIGYFHAAEWSGVDDDDRKAFEACPEPLWSASSIRAGKADCAQFRMEAGELLDGQDPGRAGHDFWLTRNHHGAGFWDGDYPPAVGEALTVLSHRYGECWVSFDASSGTLWIE